MSKEVGAAGRFYIFLDSEKWQTFYNARDQAYNDLTSGDL